MLWGVIAKHQRDSQLEYEAIVAMQGRIEGETVLKTYRELAAGHLMAQIEDGLQLGCGVAPKATISPSFPNRRYSC